MIKLNVEKKNEIVRRLEKTKKEEETLHFIEERKRRDRKEVEQRKQATKDKVRIFVCVRVCVRVCVCVCACVCVWVCV